jgi:hypothetical protein
MKYNILFESSLGGGYNLMELDESKLPIVIDAYEYGKASYTLAGKSILLQKLSISKSLHMRRRLIIMIFRNIALSKK